MARLVSYPFHGLKDLRHRLIPLLEEFDSLVSGKTSPLLTPVRTTYLLMVEKALEGESEAIARGTRVDPDDLRSPRHRLSNRFWTCFGHGHNGQWRYGLVKPKLVLVNRSIEVVVFNDSPISNRNDDLATLCALAPQHGCEITVYPLGFPSFVRLGICGRSRFVGLSCVGADETKQADRAPSIWPVGLDEPVSKRLHPHTHSRAGLDIRARI